MVKNTTVARGYSGFASSLRLAGYKATPPRLRLLCVLEEAEAPLSIQDIIKRFKKHKVDQVTVYRTLKTLADIGLVRQVDFQHAHAHYELNTGDDHHHLVCTMCGTVEDFEGCDFSDMSRSVLKKTKKFQSIQHHTMEFFGICNECSKKNNHE